MEARQLILLTSFFEKIKQDKIKLQHILLQQNSTVQLQFNHYK